MGAGSPASRHADSRATTRRSIMKLPVPNVRHGVVWALSLGLIGALLLAQAQAQQKLEIKNVAEKKLKQLPGGPLFWRIETLPTLAQAQAAAGETSLVAE